MKKYRVKFDIFDLKNKPIGFELIVNRSQAELLDYLEEKGIIDGFESYALENITDLSEK